MIGNIFYHESKTIESGALVVAMTGVVGGALGVLRNAMLASRFGAGPELDAYFAAFRIPDFIYNIIVFGALTAGFMPVFSKSLLSGKDKAWELASGMMNLFLVVLGLFALAISIFSRQFAVIIAPGFQPEQINIVSELLKVMMLQPILLALANVVVASLQSFKRFFITSLSSVMYNLGIIVGIVWFSRAWGIWGLAWGVVFGAFLSFVTQLPVLYGLGFRWYAGIFGMWREIREVITLTIPRTVNLLVAQINFFVITAIASILAAGTLSVYTFAADLAGFPLTLFGLSFATVAFPTLSQFWAKGDRAGYRRVFEKTFTEVAIWNIVVALAAVAFREPLVRLTLSYGAFSESAYHATVGALVVFLLSLPAQSAFLLMLRAFFAMGNTRTPLMTALLGSALTIAASYIFGRMFGAAGLAVGPGMSAYLQTALLFRILKRKLGSFDDVVSRRAIVRAMLLGLIVVVVGEISWRLTGFFIEAQDFRWTLMRFVFALLPTAIVFGISMFVLRMREMMRLGTEESVNGVTSNESQDTKTS